MAKKIGFEVGGKKKTQTTDLIINNIDVRTINRQNLDIARWRTAIKRADSETSPSFIDLYEIYEDCKLDSRLRFLMNKRKSKVIKNTLRYTVGGKEIESITRHINSNTFRAFMRDCLDTINYNHSLLQFDYSRPGEFDYVLVPRRHVNPIKHEYMRNANDIVGLKYREEATLPILELTFDNNRNEYGLLSSAAQWVIYKRNGVGDWAQFIELFGQGLREGTYDAFDEEGRLKLLKDLTEMGSSGVMIHPKNTEVKIIESAEKGSSSDLFKSFVKDLCNMELTILYLGNNLSSESGDKGARSLGEVQVDGENEIIQDDRQWLLNVLNSEPFATYFSLFFPEAKGGEFSFEEVKDMDPKAKVDMFAIAAQHVPIPDEEWYKALDIAVPEQSFIDKRRAEMADIDVPHFENVEHLKSNRKPPRGFFA